MLIARNEQNLIGKTISSIMNQSVKPYRVIVIDDRSDDETAKVATDAGAEVISVPESIERERIYFKSLSKKRDYGLRILLDDSVDWIYSGDADMILPPRYCETLTDHADKHGAYVCAGIEPKRYDLLPMEGCQMFRLGWVRDHNIHMNYESIYMCCQALATGHATIASYRDDCIVHPQRPTGKYHTSDRQIKQATFMRNMGASQSFLIWKTVSVLKLSGVRHAWNFFNAWRRAEVLERAGVKLAFRAILSDHMRGKLTRRGGSMFVRHDDAMVCKMPETNRGW